MLFRSDAFLRQRRMATGITLPTAGCQVGISAKPTSTIQSKVMPGIARADGHGTVEVQATAELTVIGRPQRVVVVEFGASGQAFHIAAALHGAAADPVAALRAPDQTTQSA